jgi:hypothetical protein
MKPAARATHDGDGHRPSPQSILNEDERGPAALPPHQPQKSAQPSATPGCRRQIRVETMKLVDGLPGLGGDALDRFLPQRGSAYQPRATPWESGHAHFRVLTSRRSSHHPTRAALAPKQCAASSERIHTHQPCPGCIPTIPSLGLHPGLVCVDPLGQTGPSISQGCTLGWYALTL